MLPPELIDKILSYSSIEEAFKLSRYLSKSSFLKITKQYDIQKWLYDGNTKYFDVAEPYLNFDWNDPRHYKTQSIHINSIKKYKNKFNLELLLEFQKLSSLCIETLYNYTFTKSDFRMIAKRQSLSENFIVKYKNHLNIPYISYDVVPSDEFIEQFKNQIRWESFATIRLPKEFIIKYDEFLDLRSVAYQNDIPLCVIEKNIHRIHNNHGNYWNQPLSEYIVDKYTSNFSLADTPINALNFSEEFLVKYANIIGWTLISSWGNLKESFIDKYHDKVDWHMIVYEQKLSDTFVEKYKHRIEQSAISNHIEINLLWNFILWKPTISEEYMEIHIDKIIWDFGFGIESYNIKQLSEQFSIKYENKIDWCYMYRWAKIPESVIIRHINNNFNNCKDNWSVDSFHVNWVSNEIYIYWNYISRFPNLSESFIETYQDRLNWYYIDRYQTHLSREFRDRYREEYYLDY